MSFLATSSGLTSPSASASGTSGAPYGNYTISVDPGDGAVTLILPAPLRHLANAPRGRYRLQRDGRLRAAVSELLDLAHRHGCAGIAIENLGFHDARATGRETMGRGRNGKRFRRVVCGMPTAKFRERLSGMAFHAGLVVVAVDPAYTSRWGGQHWQKPLQQQARTSVTRHHGASVAIGRRALGHGIRRRPGVTGSDRRIAGRRATGQTVPRPRTCGTTGPPRTVRTPNTGDKTHPRQGDQLVLLPDLDDRSRGHRLSPVHDDSANTDRHQ